MLKNATFRQLAALHAVARLGSVSRAASELNLTQPAVSIQLKLLEESAGTPLLERDGRGVRLTGAGELMADYAARILDLWREAGDDMAAQRGVFSGRLRVGAVTTAEYLLPPLLVAFAGRQPQIKVKLRVGNRDEIVQMLARRDIDLAIMGRPPAELQTTSAAFAMHPMAFLAAPSHPLMARQGLKLADLQAANLLVRERGSGTRAALERMHKDADTPLRIGSELSSNEAIKQMCAAGLGVAFLSLHTCGLELQAGLLATLPMAGKPVERQWFVMHLASRRLTQVAAAFKTFLVEEGQGVILEKLRVDVVMPAQAGIPPSVKRRQPASRASAGFQPALE